MLVNTYSDLSTWNFRIGDALSFTSKSIMSKLFSLLIRLLCIQLHIYLLRLTYLLVLMSHRCMNTTFYVNLQQLNSVEYQLLHSIIVYFTTWVERKGFQYKLKLCAESSSRPKSDCLKNKSYIFLWKYTLRLNNINCRNEKQIHPE